MTIKNFTNEIITVRIMLETEIYYYHIINIR